MLTNKKNEKLQCSLFEPLSLTSCNESDSHLNYPCVIYCHCNSGSRLEALGLLPSLISKGIALFCFDFTGSGISDGEYVTLGVHESLDLECIVSYLQESVKISNLVVWGRR